MGILAKIRFMSIYFVQVDGKGRSLGSGGPVPILQGLCEKEWVPRKTLAGPLNAKSRYLSIGGPPDLRLALSEEAEVQSMQKCE